MIKLMFFLVCFYFNIKGFICYADYSKAQIFKNEKSECRVEASAGEYPDYTVIKGKKIIFKKKETASNVIFSTNGNFIAIGDTNIAPIDIGKDKYHLAIINCQTEKVKGYLNINTNSFKSKDGWENFISSASPLSFDNDNRQLNYIAYIWRTKGKDSKEISENLTVVFEKSNSLP